MNDCFRTEKEINIYFRRTKRRYFYEKWEKRIGRFHGDANGDDVIDLTDVACYLEHYACACANMEPQTDCFVMDMNGDNEIIIEEAALVLNTYARNAAGLE